MLTPLDELMVGSHAFLGLLALIAGVWFFAEVRKQQVDLRVVKFLSVSMALVVWLSWITAGWWYITYYPIDRAVITAGPMAFAHNLVMESKEHFFYIGLLLSTALPFYVNGLSSRLASGDAAAKRFLIVLIVIIVVGGVVLEMMGGLISIAAKYSWMSKTGGG